MSEQVKRYDYGYVDDGNGGRYLGLIERDTGKLVRHDDYEREVRCAIAAGIRMQDKCDALHAEVEALRAENAKLRTALAEQGERQEVFAYGSPKQGVPPILAETWKALPEQQWAYPLPLYTTPQPGQDVRALAASLYQACGAYDMPTRILDVLSAAANGKPFAHMIDGLLPCVPPSDQEVRALVEALEECAASLAWNCFGECRAVHAGPIMPAAMALDTARAALDAHRQAHPQ